MSVARDEHTQSTAFNTEQYVPLWIPLIYLASNLVLNSLNIYWFGKMIETIRTRFDPPLGTKGVASGKVSTLPSHDDSEDSDLGVGQPGKRHEKDEDVVDKTKGSVKAAREKAEEALNGPVGTVTDTKVERSLYDDGHTGVEVTGTQRRSARSRRKA